MEPSPRDVSSDRSAGVRIQSLAARLVARPQFWIAVMAVPFGWPIYLALTTKTPAPIPVVGTLAPFSVRDQQGRAFGKTELANRVWVMNAATLEDPALEGSTHALEKVQYRARNLGDAFGIVTWVIDGSPVDRVTAYVKTRPISPRMWWFVPTTPTEVLESFEDAVGKAVGGPLSDSDRKKLLSGDTLFLSDSTARLRGIYDASDEDSVDRLLHDAGLLINRGY